MKPLRERLKNYILNPVTKCWDWRGKITNKNRPYGRLMVNGKMIMAHRASYLLFKGRIDKGLEIDHLCKNTRCINPEHLEAVSHSVNIYRGKKTGCFKKGDPRIVLHLDNLKLRNKKRSLH